MKYTKGYWKKYLPVNYAGDKHTFIRIIEQDLLIIRNVNEINNTHDGSVLGGGGRRDKSGGKKCLTGNLVSIELSLQTML